MSSVTPWIAFVRRHLNAVELASVGEAGAFRPYFGAGSIFLHALFGLEGPDLRFRSSEILKLCCGPGGCCLRVGDELSQLYGW